jgi:hypothetical protein
MKTPFIKLPTLKPSAALKILVLADAIFRQEQLSAAPASF